MNSRDRESSSKLLSLRESESLPGNKSIDEAGNLSVVKTDLIDIPITESLYNKLYNRQVSKDPIIFEPLDEDGERYIREHMKLPAMDWTKLPDSYYINPHPTASMMSSGANSANEWWDKVDYSDEEVGELECAHDRHIEGQVHWYPAKTKRNPAKTAAVHSPHENLARDFPKTLKMQRDRKLREFQEEEEKRAEIISKLEKRMVSLYNLKRQYRRTLDRQGCTAKRTTSLPPVLGVAVDDKLLRQREMLVSRINRKKLEDEIKRKKQIERKINIVMTILNEQKQKEKELKRKRNKEMQLNTKQKKIKDDSRLDVPDKLGDVSDDVDHLDAPIEDAVADVDRVEDTVETQVPPDESPASPESLTELQTPDQSPRKTSKSPRKEKKSEASGKQERKSKKERTKKDTMDVEGAPAICEPLPEPPASQTAELSLWFENLRENISGQNSCDQKLPEENEVALKPPKIVFKNVLAGRRQRQLVVLTNTGPGTLQCRVGGIQKLTFADTSSAIQTALSGPSKARSGQSWTLTVTLEPSEGMSDGSAEVLMECCREDVRSRISVVVEVLIPRAEPILSTNTIRFGPQMFWCNGPITQQLQISNPGSLGCQVYWTEVAERIGPQAVTESFIESDGNDKRKSEVIRKQSTASGEAVSSKRIAAFILESALDNVFKTFRIDSQQPCVLPARSQIFLPVRFVPAKSSDRGNVFTKFRFYFEDGNVGKESQELIIYGKIEHSPLRLEYEIVNMKLCYSGGTVQQARMVVHSSARYACRLVVRQPRSLASVVSVVPRSTMVAAKSYVIFALRLVLGWDFLDKPCRYLDTASGLIMFPVTVAVMDIGAPPLVATVIASLVPACPLTLAPPMVDLGAVTTTETVEVDLHLTNHCPRPYRYAFVNMPPSIMIEPGGGTGSILPTETVKLKLLFSPTAQDVGMDCGRPGGEGEVNITLRCFTTVSLASSMQSQQPQKDQLSQQESLFGKSGTSTKYTVSLHTSLSSSKAVSQTGSLGYFGEGGGRNESKRRVMFQGPSITGTSDELGVHVPINKYDEDRQKVDGEIDGGVDRDVNGEVGREEPGGKEVGGEEEEGEKVYNEDYVTISEIKEERHDLPTEDLWDFYSTFQFNKCSKKDLNEGRSQKIANKEDNYKNKSDSSKSEVHKSIEDTEVGHTKERSSQSVIKSGSKENVNGEDITVMENIYLVDDLENVNENETVTNNFSVEEVESVGTSGSTDSESEKRVMLEEESKDVCLLPDSFQRFTTVSIKAFIMDPLVELSSQTVVLPPTPCTSYSIAHIYLMSRQQKPCSIHEKITKYKTKFQFRSPSKNLIIEPRNGYISYKQIQKICLIYSPTMSIKDISDKALEIKGENLKLQKVQDMLNDYYKSKEIKEAKSKVGDKKEGKQSKDEDIKTETKSEANNKKSKKGKEKKSKASVEIKGAKAKVGGKKAGKQSNDEGITTEKSEANGKKSKTGKEKKSKASIGSVKTKKNKESLKSSKLRKKSSGALPDVLIDPAEVTVMDEDLKYAEMTMLKYLEPYQETLTLLCLLETDVGNSSSRRQETLRCDVLCSVVAPTIYLSTPACLDFGPVAVGTSSRLEATITNISFFDAFVRLSTLNPLGPFSCPAHLERPFWRNGELELPPEHILTVPITFEPSDSSEVVEAFEVVSGSTVLQMQARGRGIPASFTFHPDQEVFTITSAAGKKADVTISISNSCEAPLRFRISLEYLKEGQSLPAPTIEQAPVSVTSPKQKKDLKKEKKGKGLPEFTVLDEELKKCLDNDFIDLENIENMEPVIKILNNDENIIVGNGETKQIIFRFMPPAIKQEVNVIKSPKSAKESTKYSPQDKKKINNKSLDKQGILEVNTKVDKTNKKKKQSSEGKGERQKDSLPGQTEKEIEVKTKQIYAARFSVVLAGTQKVKDWVILGMKK